jgi:S-sulfo-L-cysteine synthase (3-phospho-L-serine-dependent)
MSRPWLIFVESNTTGTGRLFVRAAAECGYSPALLAGKPERYSFIQQEALRVVPCDTGSMADLRRGMEGLRSVAPVAGILSSSEYFIGTAAALAQEYELPGPDAEALQVCRSKLNQRRILEKAGLLTPGFQRVTSSQGAMETLKRVPLPVVLKPVCGSGSVGVRLCRTSEEVLEHSAILLHRTANERGMPVSPELLIEEYLVGPEFSAEVFNGSVIGITRKHISAEPFFVELGHDFPAGLPAEANQAIIDVVQHGLRALHLTWGPAHVELRLTAKGPAIIEVNPRLAGGFIPELVRLAFGIDMVRETIRLAGGETSAIKAQRGMYASIRFVTPAQNGTIQRIDGVAAASAIQNVVDVQMYRSCGDRAKIENDFRDRIGHVISRADSPAGAARAAETGHKQIRVQLAMNLSA